MTAPASDRARKAAADHFPCTEFQFSRARAIELASKAIATFERETPGGEYLKGYCDRPQGCACAVDHFRSGCAHWHKTTMGHVPSRAALTNAKHPTGER